MKINLLLSTATLLLACSATIYAGPGATIGIWPEIVLFNAAPNPCDNESLIRVYFPRNDPSASIKIFNADSTLVKTIPLAAETGTGSAVINTTDLQNGNYTYQLYYEGENRYTKALTVKHATASAQ